MKPQFELRSLLLAVAFACVGMGGGMAAVRLLNSWPKTAPVDSFVILTALGLQSPFWIQLVILAYAIGQRSLTVRTVLLLAIAEAVALGLVMAEIALNV
jgi:hypothetical protein